MQGGMQAGMFAFGPWDILEMVQRRWRWLAKTAPSITSMTASNSCRRICWTG